MSIQAFTFNAFSENTYVLYNPDGSGLIVDPGMNEINERRRFQAFLREKNITPTHIINTHCHIDHVLGNKWCKDTFQIPLGIPDGEQPMLDSLSQVAKMYGMQAEPSPDPDFLMPEGGELLSGSTRWQFISAPGHSPASICLYDAVGKVLIAGDVLFFESIGRTDLPGGNHRLLLQNIDEKLMTLPDEVMVYPGHGPATTIGHERVHNPFIN